MHYYHKSLKMKDIMKYIYLILFLLLTSRTFGLFQVGDIVYNMEWLDSNNEEHSIEELTSQNKTIVIFYGLLTCSYCILSSKPFQDIWQKLNNNNNVYMISNSDWGKTHTHPYCKDIGNDRIYDGQNPLMLVIGKNRVLMHFDHESGYSGSNQDGILLKEAIEKCWRS